MARESIYEGNKRIVGGHSRGEGETRARKRGKELASRKVSSWKFVVREK